jgi:hypothetical protein
MKRRLGLVLDSLPFEVLLYTAIFLLNLRLFCQQVGRFSDISRHIQFVHEYIDNGLYIPHPLFHILAYDAHRITGLPYAFVVPFLMSALSVLSILLTKRLIKFYRPGFQHEFVYVVTAVAANYAIAIYVPWYNARPYLGQWSPNIWHSPTMMLLKPLALLGFWGTVHYVSGSGVNRRRVAWLTSLALLIGATAKPSFIVCLAPALALFLLVYHWKDYRLYRDTFLMLLPSLLLLSCQFIETYTVHAQPSYFHDSIIVTNFTVTRMFAPSVLVSTLLVAAFPLSVFWVVRGRATRNAPLMASWFLVLVGFLQASFLAEKAKPFEGAFVFGYVISLFLLFLFSLIECLGWCAPRTEPAVSFKEKAVVAAVAAAHLASGVWYYSDLVAGKYLL